MLEALNRPVHCLVTHSTISRPDSVQTQSLPGFYTREAKGPSGCVAVTCVHISGVGAGGWTTAQVQGCSAAFRRFQMPHGSFSEVTRGDECPGSSFPESVPR